ncbi:4-alpha-glucanotransferase : 4-alpha-glucanotransferase OS=Roseiflexus castenholzii (strain DSM 13941 / HLO8) GN=Rcas_2645 PE=3 SV=1: Glyco_hydro_77 [Gemmataceae bacterium]|nr:4-alpha-glucanotransferase : 4-alpha-glucanotransferase OS=Roseiflexus castenholzii (strain DSM 13941 / HLO8) GN=Rcas_2645 PE=3 SV=1: Glyco_hydro_77 [Gemmataceae bacterium]VTT97829.1 4-alpha-glucanotransferase : 4-alpha-glucanotransferase OS=Roseiflexus castenholzii (strain DSM 13941 / HLO8) GN=Rcas_2645 PE=3 SV=1: Glyco_hydro_77 [Gemmataceae bacterium]
MPAHVPMPRPRTAGILLHPTSLPGPYGVGDLGPAARAWVDLLARAGQTWWQVLPLNPPGAGDSPYSAFSAFAGNPLLVSPDDLAADGLLRTDELEAAHLPAGPVNYPLAAAAKNRLLTRAWARFRDGAAPELLAEYTKFAASAEWLEDYALFTAIKETVPAGVWTDWPAGLVARDPAALDRARTDLADAVARERFAQFCFARQLAALRGYAAARGVKLLGDMPIFISGDSADVWAAPHLFDLDADRRPRFVAGVPPDYFAVTGQRWGNPQYNWDAMRADGFAWWAARVRATLAQVDAVRLDHFRGFEAYWEIPARCPTAIEGRWVKGPGAELLAALRDALGELPLVAEDLGLITPEVDELRERFGFPGMRILQFAFGGAVEARFLPHAFDRNVVAYTGTHDNDTTRGWYAGLTPHEVAALERYAPEAKADPVWALIRLALASVADTAIVPLQDVLDLGTEARMNVPGTVGPWNWSWRATAEQLAPAAFDRLGALTATYGRASAAPR